MKRRLRDWKASKGKQKKKRGGHTTLEPNPRRSVQQVGSLGSLGNESFPVRYINGSPRRARYTTGWWVYVLRKILPIFTCAVGRLPTYLSATHGKGEHMRSTCLRFFFFFGTGGRHDGLRVLCRRKRYHPV